MRTVSAAETAATIHPWAIHAKGLRVRAGRHLAVDGLDLSLGTGVHGLLGPERRRQDHPDPRPGHGRASRPAAR